ncbi:MAG: hypothetical protein GC196_05690 [Hyphomonas sp.]|jgi:hypothetical protein|uniref:hypothetical protein n=1 Tax=Hyphomonas sp. TaxID=87 RepID=UPI0037BF27BA|nr:hypothetical protein [Hyphomonas sp.]
MSMHHAFELLIAAHIITGAPGLAGFWVPISARKGGRLHQLSGQVFVGLMLATASFAAMMATLTLLEPLATHPKLASHEIFGRPEIIRGIFGWMMLFLAILTINLAWYGRACILNRTDHARHRSPLNIALQVVLTAAALNCAVQGILIGQWMMVGISAVGFATVGTNLWFMLRARTQPLEWLTEHIKALVGTGISVYTAFLAFGAVRYVPELALSPLLWSIPLIVGVSLILYHQRAATAPLRRARTKAAA